MVLKLNFLFLLLSFIYSGAFAQINADSIPISDSDSVVLVKDEGHRFKYPNFILPAVFISYGVASMTNHPLKQLNLSTRDEMLEGEIFKTHLDNYSQYFPAVMVYGLNAFGVKGKHNFKDRTIIYATSQLISAAIVVPLKRIVREKRPDESDDFSFPSGHTATAFSSAHFMFREYKDSNLWLSFSGYPFAVFTGVYRTINNKHWVGDVAAGAGIGILSTELAYMLSPVINGFLFKGKNNTTSLAITPFYQNKNAGLSLVSTF